MKLTEILDKRCIQVGTTAADKMGLITELVDALHDSGQIVGRDEVLNAVIARERTRSTGIGLGLAVPHGKSRGSRSLTMAVAKLDDPMAFDAIDGRPCGFVVLLASPHDKTGPHIQALAQVSRLWQRDGFREAVQEAKTADAVYAAFEQFAD